MPVLVATIVASVVWIVLWAIGVKAFDAFMLAAAIVVLVATARITARYLPGREPE